MELNFTIIGRAFSINKAYYKNRQRTQACRAWGDAILEQLFKMEDHLKQFHDHVEENINDVNLVVKLIFYIPEDKMFTAKGKVSRRGQDLTNVEKLFIDLLFDKRYNERGWVNLNLDDTLITRLISEKRVSKDNSYEIRVHVSTRSNIQLT